MMNPVFFRDRQPSFAETNRFLIFSSGNMVSGLPDMGRHHEVNPGVVASGRAGHLPRFVDASSATLDLPAPEVDQRKEHQKARKERVLAEGACPRHCLLAKGNAGVPLACRHRVFEQNLRGPEIQNRRPQLFRDFTTSLNMAVHHFGLAQEALLNPSLPTYVRHGARKELE